MTNAIKLEMISELKEILGDDFDMLVDSYMVDAKERLEKLKSAISAGDADSIRVEAHSLKGSSLNLGAQTLPQLCSTLESCGKENQLGDVSALFVEIQAEFLRVEAALINCK